MTAVQARTPVVECRARRAFNPRREAEALFSKLSTRQPRILEDVSKESVEAAVANLLPPEPPASPITPAEETPHQKVFRLVGERRFEEAARLAKSLIDAGDVGGFFIYGGTPSYRKGDIIISDKVKASRKGAFSEIINITPEIAQRILSRNPNNRKIVVRAGSGLAGKMRDILGGALAPQRPNHHPFTGWRPERRAASFVGRGSDGDAYSRHRVLRRGARLQTDGRHKRPAYRRFPPYVPQHSQCGAR